MRRMEENVAKSGVRCLGGNLEMQVLDKSPLQRAPFAYCSPWVVENLQKGREILWFFVHMDALAPIGLVCIPRLGFLDHIRKHRRTATEVVGVGAEEESLAREDDVSGRQVKLWVLRYGVAFAWG